MARDFEDIHDLDDLNGEELRALVLEHLAGHDSLDIGELTVRIDHGTVILGGRVGTDSERLIAEHVVTDQLGAVECRNEIVVDPNYRAMNPEAADDDAASDDRATTVEFGDRVESSSAGEGREGEDLGDDLFGTTDVQSAIEDGNPWVPPDNSTSEGLTETGEIGESR
jgi:hypothetical protein